MSGGWAKRSQAFLTLLELLLKWSVDQFRPEGALAFARAYPQAELVVVAQDVDRPFRRTLGGTDFEFLGLATLIERLA